MLFCVCDGVSSYPFVPVQFQCCGFNNASDWSELNVDAIIMNNGHPPRCLMCVTGQQNCQNFEYNQTVTVGGVTVTETKSFNTTDVVR